MFLAATLQAAGTHCASYGLWGYDRVHFKLIVLVNSAVWRTSGPRNGQKPQTTFICSSGFEMNPNRKRNGAGMGLVQASTRLIAPRSEINTAAGILPASPSDATQVVQCHESAGAHGTWGIFYLETYGSH